MQYRPVVAENGAPAPRRRPPSGGSAAEGGALNRQRLIPQWGVHWVALAGLTLPRIAADIRLLT